MAPSVGGGDGGGVDGGVIGLELPPSTLAEDGMGLPGLQRPDFHLQCCPRTQPDESQVEP